MTQQARRNPGAGRTKNRITSVTRNGRPYPVASDNRAWGARIVDGGLVVLLTATGFTLAAVLVSSGGLDSDLGLMIGLGVYPLVLVFLGVLYGCRCSPGQLLFDVVSLRAWTGRRVGVWRGAWRYLGVGLAPLWVVVGIVWLVLFILSIFDSAGAGDPGSIGYSEPVAVVRRRLPPGSSWV
ncbi:RDD family protein [Kocuria sp. JC486]|uniref:RDD family protein n=1 Tax=Kocuria sp. JC486 TaxID=1970736 RepID=UPI00141D9D6D|nr:RDD family protein [Kocuria sp. JC486]NHU84184.1 RDD family protein [Kocuria sp. JC486]